MSKKRGLLIRGNSKLGNDIWHFSLPAVHTCPGRSESCEKLCYARKGLYAMPSVKTSAQVRESARHAPDFVTQVAHEIASNKIATVRIHVSGDFDTADYVKKWAQIIKQAPKVKFFFYTRSWRIPSIWVEIEKLAKFSNVNAWLSCDKDTGQPPANKQFGVAYMALHDTDVPAYTTDIVFRVSRPTVLTRWANKSTVCPVERKPSGDVDHGKLNCSTCKLCHGDKLVWLRKYKKAEVSNV